MSTSVPAAPSRLRAAAGTWAGGLPRVFWVLWVGTLVNRLGAFVVPFLVLYLTEKRGMSVTAAGGALTAFGLGAMFASPVGGALADRVGRRATLVTGMLTASVAMLALGAARGVAWIVITAFLVGLTGELFRPASQALVADVVPPGQRPSAYGLIFWANNLGWAVATTAAGFLASRGYGLLFVVDAATSAAFAFVVWRLITEPPRTRPSERPAGGSGTALRDRPFLGFVGLQFLFACVLFQIFSTVPLAMRADGLSPAAYGIAFAVNAMIIVVIQPLLVHRLARLPRSPTLAASQLLFGLGFATIGFASSLPGYAVALGLATFGEIGVQAIAAAMVADFAPPESRGRYYGVFGLAFASAAVVAPLVGTSVFAAVGGDAVFAACAVAGVVMCGGQLLLAPSVARRAARLSALPAAPVGAAV